MSLRIPENRTFLKICQHSLIMKRTSLPRVKVLYPQPKFLLPLPYILFHRSLLNLSGLDNTPRKSDVQPLTGVDLFGHVASLKTSAYAQSSWDRLTEEQRDIFVNPPAEVHEHYMRITQGYNDCRLAFAEEEAVNPFFRTHLYPWEIIKDKLRNRPAFASDVYDHLIQEAMSPPVNMFKPTLLYRNWKACATPHKKNRGSFQGLHDSRPARFVLEAERKCDYAQRKTDFVRAKKSRSKGFETFKKEYSRELGDKMSDLEKEVFIKEQWEFETDVDCAGKRKANKAVFREMKLETHLAMVMDYIFEHNSVVFCDVDWRDWRKRVSGGYHYLDKIMFPYVVNTTLDGIDLRRSLPSHLEWQRPPPKIDPGEYSLAQRLLLE